MCRVRSVAVTAYAEAVLSENETEAGKGMEDEENQKK
jgi:hypothetical protein